MRHIEPSHRKPITDSPWFWCYLFATAALFGLMLIGPKFAIRNLQVQRQYEGRQRALQSRAGDASAPPMSSIAETQSRLIPLYWILALVLVVGWIGFWWFHLRGSREKDASKVV